MCMGCVVSWSLKECEEIPHRKGLTTQHTLPCCSPRICLMFWISALPVICAVPASLTFSSLPLRRGEARRGEER